MKVVRLVLEVVVGEVAEEVERGKCIILFSLTLLPFFLLNLPLFFSTCGGSTNLSRSVFIHSSEK